MSACRFGTPLPAIWKMEKTVSSNRLYRTLMAMEKSLHRNLVLFLQSPLYVNGRQPLLLCEGMLAYVTTGASGFSKEKIWKKVAGNTAYNDVLFRKYCSGTLKLVHLFLAQESLAASKINTDFETLDFAIEHKIEPVMQSAAESIREELNRGFKSVKYYYDSYRFEKQYYTMMDFGVKVDQKANLTEISTSLDVFYWIEKLKLASAAISQKKTLNYSYDTGDIEAVLAQIRRFPLEHHPALALEYYAFLTVYDEDEADNYHKLKQGLEQFADLLPRKDALDLIDAALHFCTGRINKGNQDFIREYFELFENGLKKGIFLIKGELAVWRFNNIVAAALRLGKADWAEDFIESNYPVLPEDSRENTRTFNLARVYRYQKRYGKVLELLRNVEYADIGYNLISKAVLLITYYELNERETLASFTVSFRTFLNRQRDIPVQRREGYLNLVRFTRKLMKLERKDVKSADKLRDEIIQNRSNTVNHDWLLEKLNEKAR
ncbi:MAG: hypothetical protein RL013_1912 [Bacteroidota bacterium]